MRRISLFATLAAGFCVCASLACSGGGGGGTGLPSATTTSSGVITGFGSVKLVGKEYETQDASFVIDGLPGSQNDLKVGMVVTVNGSLSSSGTRTAATITQQDVVEGAIQTIPSTNDRIVVLGQTVLIDDGTLFDNNIPGQNISGLVPGDLVEVNGFVKSKGLIIATLIEKKHPPAACEVQGIIENNNHGAQTFTIGSLTVSYSSAVFNDMPSTGGNAWNDILVEVKGSPCTQALQPFIATKVEPERIDVANADEIEVEGTITQFNSASSFAVNGVPVVTNSSTDFEGGDASDLALGVEVEVGGFLTDGVLTAEKVSFRDKVEIEGDVAALTSGGATPNLTVSGLPGITVFVNVQTEFKEGISNLSQLGVGNHVRVRGRPTGTNTVIAAEVRKRSPDTQVTLGGAVQAVANPNVTVLGVLIDTSTIPDGKFKGLHHGATGRAAFFNAVKVGTLVNATGDLMGGMVLWNEIEFQGEGS